MDTFFDVGIIGAGPGGSRAARECLAGGLAVVQLEKAQLPRLKPCAGGLTGRSLAALSGWRPAGISVPSPGVRFSAGCVRCRLSHPAGMLHFVHRPDFDHRLAMENLQLAGLTFLAGEAVESVQVEEPSLFRLVTDRRTIFCRQLIAADGSRGITGRLFQVARPRGRATALEVEIRRDWLGTDPCPEPRFDFGVVSRGYGWVFPKQDRWSVGLYTLERTASGLRRRLEEYLREMGFGGCAERAMEQSAGHTYGVGAGPPRIPESPVYLVGDAVGLAEAAVGEGIYHALESGRLAGITALRRARGMADHRDYYRALRPLVWDSTLSWLIARLFYRDVGTGLKRFVTSGIWRPLVQGYVEGRPLGDCLKALPRLWLGSAGNIEAG
jgi:flavin-dependent dehydrogenase